MTNGICDSIEETTYNIQWVKAGNPLVADHNPLGSISWGQLNMWGLVFGADEKAVHKEPQKQSLEDVISRAKSLADQSAKLISDL